jgi:hypothetical protein
MKKDMKKIPHYQQNVNSQVLSGDKNCYICFLNKSIQDESLHKYQYICESSGNYLKLITPSVTPMIFVLHQCCYQ